VRELEAEIAELKKARQKSAKPAKSDPAADAMGAIMAKLDALETRLDGEQAAKKQAALVDATLQGVPDKNRDMARMIIAGMNSSGAIDLASIDSEALSKQLKAQHAQLYAVAGSQSSALQRGTNGEYDWDSITSLSQVPQEAYKDMPDAHFRRLTRGVGSGAKPLLLGGKANR
jgi:hypothetical protein